MIILSLGFENSVSGKSGTCGWGLEVPCTVYTRTKMFYLEQTTNWIELLKKKGNKTVSCGPRPI